MFAERKEFTPKQIIATHAALYATAFAGGAGAGYSSAKGMATPKDLSQIAMFGAPVAGVYLGPRSLYQDFRGSTNFGSLFGPLTAFVTGEITGFGGTALAAGLGFASGYVAAHLEWID